MWNCSHAARVWVRTCCATSSVSERGASQRFLPSTQWASLLRFHLWPHLVRSSYASRWRGAELGIFFIRRVDIGTDLKKNNVIISVSVPFSMERRHWLTFSGNSRDKVKERRKERRHGGANSVAFQPESTARPSTAALLHTSPVSARLNSLRLLSHTAAVLQAAAPSWHIHLCNSVSAVTCWNEHCIHLTNAVWHQGSNLWRWWWWRWPRFFSIHLAPGAAALHSMPFSLPCFLWGRKLAPLPVTGPFHVVTSPCFAGASVFCWLREWRWCSGRGQNSLLMISAYVNEPWLVFGPHSLLKYHHIHSSVVLSAAHFRCFDLEGKIFCSFSKAFYLLLQVWVE